MSDTHHPVVIHTTSRPYWAIAVVCLIFLVPLGRAALDRHPGLAPPPPDQLGPPVIRLENLSERKALRLELTRRDLMGGWILAIAPHPAPGTVELVAGRRWSRATPAEREEFERDFARFCREYRPGGGAQVVLIDAEGRPVRRIAARGL